MAERYDVRDAPPWGWWHRPEHWAYTKVQLDKACERSRLLSRTSRDGVGGENVAPWMPGFPYQPRDASFLGKPVDYVVFDGLDDGELQQIVFVEIKTGQAGMSKRGQQIRRAIREGRITHRLVRLERTDTAAIANPGRVVAAPLVETITIEPIEPLDDP